VNVGTIRVRSTPIFWPGRPGWIGATPAEGAGNFRLGLFRLGLEATVKVYGVAVAMPQGQSRMPNPLTGRQ
jgi:hypothetical protein